jgi:glycosyltransferase involved in cell wall biosynthesis
LAIVSTYDELCGISSYTRALERQLRGQAEVTVFNLDQYLLRNQHKKVQRLADVHIQEIAARLHAFDCVNIQLEYGTLGRTPGQILRRLRLLVLAASAVSVTFHTVFGNETLDWAALVRNLMTGRLNRVFDFIDNWRRLNIGDRTYAMMREEQRKKPVHAILHTKRDARLLQNVYNIDRVAHHPLSFVTATQAEQVRAATTRDDFPILRTLPPQAKLIGSFGFLSPYKGFETALRALHYLPDNYHLLIFGGVHPQTIKREQALDPYIKTLFEEARIGQSILDTVTGKKARLSLNLDSASGELFTRHPQDLQQRVHFLGVQNDEGFMRAMALCDIVVLPYLEVGQSSSGPLSLALEMGCRVLASRTLAFLQAARYYPGQIEFFDIGNYAELVDLIRADGPAPGADRKLAFNTKTNTTMYLQANLPRPHGWRRPTGVERQAPTAHPEQVESML